MAIVEGTRPDANRTPALDVTYGEHFKLNAHDIRTQAIIHPKVLGTTAGDSVNAFSNISNFGQTLDQGVRVKNFGGKITYIRVEDIGCTFDGPTPSGGLANRKKAYDLREGEEIFLECSNLSQVHYRTDSVSVIGQDAGLTFIAS